MRLFDRFRRHLPSVEAAPARSTSSAATLYDASRPPRGFAVIDVETTGLSPRTERILELAIVRVDEDGCFVDEWVTRFNPDGPVGATHIHGITDADVADAPRFLHLVPEIARRLDGAAVVGHNVRFDLSFLRAEFERAGWVLPDVQSACTMTESRRHLPHLERRRLADCCEALSIRTAGAHSALGDARATALLLAHFVERDERASASVWQSVLDAGAAVRWPTTPIAAPVRAARTAAYARRTSRAELDAQPLVRLLQRFHLADVLDEGARESALPYLELLVEALEDGVLSEAERRALADIGRTYDLDARAVGAAHQALLLALAHLAVLDGKVTAAEKGELLGVAELLGVPVAAVTSVLREAEAARDERMAVGLRELPPDWALGEPLRVGDKIAFTGCDPQWRERLERRAGKRGVRVMNSVSGRTVMLVTDGGFSGTKAAKAGELGVRLVHPDDFEVLLDHLQPSASADSTIMTSSPSPAAVPGDNALDPSAVRAWARSHGMQIGDRGRLPLQVLNAYRAATATRDPAAVAP
jgi:DNA polymerase-3 subunit epsilon